MFYSNVKTDCACSKGWEKEFLYVQAIVYGLPIFFLLFVQFQIFSFQALLNIP
jgi:hypothetical protein